MKTQLLIILLFSLFSVSAQTTYQIYWSIGVNGAAASKTISVGDTVEWIWDDDFNHTVTGIAGSSVEPNFDSGNQSGLGYVYSKTFTVEGVNDYECSIHPLSMYGTITVQNSLGIDENAIAQFEMFPNPSNAILNLKLPQKLSTVDVHVYDLLGKELLNRSYENSNLIKVNISDLSRGIYLVKLSSDTSAKTKQFVKI
ncbi:T9SS type A sorting domain-containing protein [Gaetbulibacter aestuarii]|uniref:T9SS type A sorting domain-containing protein n=1 Tax=Gaetbulibacter aestuarii TaxID=1502358 RepID=A0ABW7MXK9_9FLAO